MPTWTNEQLLQRIADLYEEWEKEETGHVSTLLAIGFVLSLGGYVKDVGAGADDVTVPYIALSN